MRVPFGDQRSEPEPGTEATRNACPGDRVILDPALGDVVQKQGDVQHPAMLRLELARVLNHHRELEGDVLRQTLDPSTPAPVRLIAHPRSLRGSSQAHARPDASSRLPSDMNRLLRPHGLPLNTQLGRFP